MDANGYTAIRDNSFSFGEQYWVYHDNALVGWIRYSTGILRATHATSKDALLPSPFLIHELFGSDPDDSFSTGRLRRGALRRCLTAIANYYGDKESALSRVIAVMGPSTPVQLEQADLFGRLRTY